MRDICDHELYTCTLPLVTKKFPKMAGIMAHPSRDIGKFCVN